ncbi:hypothetical protein [Halobacillus halophilus]|uniref:hypothetical protein n=1 Tax=Halobacillus halophilus TaxID=1570 RepID=UPI001CD79002|nr:hypothetical protein [Halobacillus halophilus]MCA1011075.1 hypothetical protein [Halobacillus halophilus]
MKQALRDCLSMNEYRISAIIIGFFITLGVTMLQYVRLGTIDMNVQNLILTFIYVIGGIQVSQHVKDIAIRNRVDTLPNDEP